MQGREHILKYREERRQRNGAINGEINAVYTSLMFETWNCGVSMVC